ncbi:putative receptor-type tyrosine-protein phosphatase alpha-like isoform X1 [Apostichopus japonicus]|uniref:Putative receptor-type tyrosine-protein phosphatase alpha-like isoform X1 n=1 Tax=Stichopus japonicus TaxID=307972 RepID=A0A2G8K9J4_STIJA|nr:putative receptor-type tyrosine-protein phosphatase alpha-like isoform X1 [Apostichopus japonicus]
MPAIVSRENALDAANVSGLIKLMLDARKLPCTDAIRSRNTVNVQNESNWSSVTCWSRELTGDSPRYPVNLVRSLSSPDDPGVYLSNRFDSQSDNFTLRGWNYTIDNPQAGDQFYCWIPTLSSAQLNANLSYYELLVLSNPPELLDITNTSMDIRWMAWDEEIDVGDPPLVGYVVHIKGASSTLWNNRSVMINSLEYRLIHLEHDTNYTVSVSAVREGEKGEGPRGPSITVKTLCQVPTITPTNIAATVTNLNHLNITWQIDYNNITCSTGIHSYTIYYKNESSGEEPMKLRVVPANTTWTIITEGLDPGLTYIFLVSFTTDHESSLGEALMAVTLPMPQSTGRDSPVGFIIIPVIIVLILSVFIISFIIYRRKNKANVLPPGQVHHSYANDVRIDDETREITDHATDDDDVSPDDIENYTGIYINIPTTDKKTSPPRPIAVSEFQSFMRRGKRSLVTDVVKEFTALPMGQQYPCSEALRYETMPKKLSDQIVPYDHSRVKVQTGRNNTQSDYYNASNIKAWGHGKTSFIAAKDPQSRIYSDRFWRMILQQGVRTIVMLTDISNTDICYWPKKDSTKEVFGETTVLLQDQSVYPYYTTRKLKAFRDLQYWFIYETLQEAQLMPDQSSLTADEIKVWMTSRCRTKLKENSRQVIHKVPFI